MLGTVAIAGKLIYTLVTAQSARDVGPLWPLLIATAGFLYLWWLAALLFDLSFVWHLYIRHARMLQRMDEIMGGKRGATPAQAPRTAAAAQAPQVQR